MSARPISLGVFGLGTWIYDPSNLTSRVVAPAPDPRSGAAPPTFGARIEPWSDRPTLGEWLTGALETLLEEGEGPVDSLEAEVDRGHPAFDGEVRVRIWAQGESTPCTPETWTQSVGWVWYADVELEGVTDGGLLGGGGFVHFRLGPFQGETETADCNGELGYLHLHDYGDGVLAVSGERDFPVVQVSREATGATVGIVGEREALRDALGGGEMGVLRKGQVGPPRRARRPLPSARRRVRIGQDPGPALDGAGLPPSALTPDPAPFPPEPAPSDVDA
jgi:hypothetical protein